MDPQGHSHSGQEPRPPWSPLTVTAIALLLPPGGALLTVWNLYRLGQLTMPVAKQVTAILTAVFAIGFAALVLLSPTGKNGVPKLDPNSHLVLQMGIAIACFTVQRAAFRDWRARNRRVPTNSPLPAVGAALVYTIVIVAAAVPVYFLIAGLMQVGHAATPV